MAFVQQKLHLGQSIFVLCSLVVLRVNCEYNYKTKYIDVPLDHFSFTNNQTFPLRYLINDTYWSPKYGPIFFYTGNEGDITMFAQNTGFMWESAQKFKALILFAEHRYYGTSLPFGNDSYSGPEKFGYLTSEQALADFVDVIRHVKCKNHGQPANCHLTKRRNPVIAFGGSYGGMLAAWMRIKYPAVIEGSLASSAPIWQFTGMIPCESFNQVVTSAFNESSPPCTENIRKSWKVLINTTSTEPGRTWINKNWKLCKPIKNGNDTLTLIGWVSNVFVNLAMINYPYPTNFLMPVPGNPVFEMCKSLNNSQLSDKKLMSAIFDALTVYFNYTGSAKCLEWSSDPSGGLGVQGWDVQSCTEMVMPMCGDGVTDMFWPNEWNFQSYSDMCFARLKVRPREYMAEKMYGGKDIRTASNIIFSNGVLDPWRSGGVTKAESSKMSIFLLEKSAHHLDLRASNEKDPSSVVTARKQYHDIFTKWIKKFYKRHSHYEVLIETSLIGTRITKHNKKTKRSH